MSAVDLAAEREAWLEQRRGGIGASDVAGILGLSPWASPWSVWADKVGLTPLDDGGETEAMEFGRRAEVMIGPWFAEKEPGLYLVGQQTLCRHATHQWRMCTADGFVADHMAPLDQFGDALGVGEIKVTADPPSKWEEKVPDHYACQAAWSSHVTGLPDVWFIVLHLAFGRPQLRIYRHTPHPVDVNYVVAHVANLWEQHVLTGIPPLTDGHHATTTAIKASYPDGDGPLDVDEHLSVVVDELGRCKDILKATKTRIDSMENELKAALADRVDLVDGVKPSGEPNVIASWRPAERTDIDRKQVRSDHGDRYDTTTLVRTLRLHTKPKPPTPPKEPS